MLVFRLLICISIAATLVGCGSTPKEKRWSLMLGGIATGTVLGSLIGPERDRKEVHAAMWGAVGGMTGALVGEYYYSNEAYQEDLKREISELKLTNELLMQKDRILIDQKTGQFQGPDGRRIDRGQVEIYKIDRWRRVGPNHLVHEDKEVFIREQNK